MAIKFLDSAGLTYFINKIVYGITSPKFSTGSTYAVGDFVIYTGNLYRCTTAVTVAGAWSASNWVQTTVKGEIKALNTNLNGLAFAKNAGGEWGYKVAGADPVIPFKGKPDNLVYYDHASLSTFTYTATKAGIYVVFVQGVFTAQTVTTTGTLLASDIHDIYACSMVYRLEIGQTITVVTTNTYGTNYGVVRAIVYVGNYTSVTKGTLSQVYNTSNSVINTYNVSAVALTFAIMTTTVEGVDGWASVSTLNESAVINQYRRKEAYTSGIGTTLFHVVVSPSLYEAYMTASGGANGSVAYVGYYTFS